MHNRVEVAIWTTAAFLLTETQAAEWPQFRGPDGQGVADSSPIATRWSRESNIQWKIPVPGVAWSSPIVWGDRVYLTTAIAEDQPKPSASSGGRYSGRRPSDSRPDSPPESDRQTDDRPADNPDQDRQRGGNRSRGSRGAFGRSQPPSTPYQWKILCLDRATGQIVWSQLAAEQKPSIPTHRTNTYASETPVTDGERIYVYFGMTGLFCYDLEGNLVWKKDLGSYPMAMGWGTGSSPVLAGNQLIIQCDNEEKSFLVALDKRTGEEKWRDDRDERSTWSTPFVWKNEIRTEIVTGGSKKTRSYDPETGEILWELSGISGRSASTPVGDPDMVYFGTGGGMGVGPLVAVKAGAKGEIDLADADREDSFIAWTVTRGGPPMASPLLYEQFLYVLDQRGGILTVYDAKSGKVAYKQRIPGATGFTASPWAADGNIYCLDGSGTTFVLQAGPDFKVLETNPLDEMCWSSPAIADGTLYLRTVDHLYCIKP